MRRLFLIGSFALAVVVVGGFFAARQVAQSSNTAGSSKVTSFTGAAAHPERDYECFMIGGTGGSPGVSVVLETQFGVEAGVQVKEPMVLCAPASKATPGATPYPTPPTDVPHLKCYDVSTEGGAGPGYTVTLYSEQFPGYPEYGVVVGPRSLLCVPVTKQRLVGSGDTPTPGPQPAEAPHYECFNIAAPGSEPIKQWVWLSTQFNLPNPSQPGEVYVTAPQFLCAPAYKTLGGHTYGDLTWTDLKCYLLGPGTLPTPTAVVNLLSQFGQENMRHVDMSNLLCVPVTKEVEITPTPTITPTKTATPTRTATPTSTRTPGGVGGVAELPPLAGTSAEEAGAPGGGSGWSSASYAALAGGLAAAAVVLSAGAWYARRRWLR